MVRKAVDIQDNSTFKMGGNVAVDILHFADDTLLIGNENWKPLWALKEVLGGFEVVSNLGVNFNKRRIC